MAELDEDDDAQAECRDWLENVIDIDCRSGVYDEANILEAGEEIIEATLGEPDPALHADFAAKVRAGLAAHAEIEATWHARTVNDNIDSAWKDLTGRGILALQALGDTKQSGRARAEQKRPVHPGSRGCVFYHRQDLERGVAGEGLWLAFDAWDTDNADEIAAIGKEVVHVLRHHGVEVEWSGEITERISITSFEWRKRRVTEAPPGAGSAPPMPPPAAPPPPCTICKGKGWLAPATAGDFASPCVCKGGGSAASKGVGAGGCTKCDGKGWIAGATPADFPTRCDCGGRSVAPSPSVDAAPQAAAPDSAPRATAPETPARLVWRHWNVIWLAVLTSVVVIKMVACSLGH